ncbi:hypothetical protein [Streptomyces cucumeris]
MAPQVLTSGLDSLDGAGGVVHSFDELTNRGTGSTSYTEHGLPG